MPPASSHRLAAPSYSFVCAFLTLLTLLLFLLAANAAATQGPGAPSQQTQAPSLVLNTGGGDGQVCALNRDGGILATGGGGDTALRLWNTKTGTLLRILMHPAPSDGNATYLEFSRDDTLLTAAYTDGAIIVWEMSSGRPQLQLQADSWVTSARLSADKRWLAAGDFGKRLYLWDMSAKREIRLPDQPERIDAMAFSPDGRWLASSVDYDERISVWECATGALVKTLSFKRADGGVAPRRLPARESPAAVGTEVEGDESPNDAPDETVLGFDGRTLIAVGRANLTTLVVKRWEIGTWTEHSSRVGTAYFVQNLLLSADGEWLLAATPLGQIKCWAVDPWRELPPFTRPSAPTERRSIHPNSLAISGDKHFLSYIEARPSGLELTREWRGVFDVQVWDVPSRRVVRSLSTPVEPYTGAFISPDGDRIVTTSSTLKMWARENDFAPQTLGESATHIRSLVFNRDGSELAFVTDEDINHITVHLVGVKTGERRSFVFDHPINRIELSADSRWLMTVGNALLMTPAVEVTDLTNGTRRKLKEAAPSGGFGLAEYILSAEFSADNSYLLLRWQRDGTPSSIEAWETKTWSKVELPGRLTETAKGLTFSPDGRFVAGFKKDAPATTAVGIWDAKTGSKTVFDVKVEGDIYRLQYSPDGRFIAGVTDDGIRVWKTSNGEEALLILNYNTSLFSPKGPAITLFTFSDDSRRLAVADQRFEVNVYEMDDSRPPRTMSGHRGYVAGLQFTHGGSRLISAGFDGSLKVSDANTGELMLTLASLRRGNEWLAIAPNGLFDGSAEAMRAVGWRAGGYGGEVYPLDAFFNDFYYPGLTSEIMDGRHPTPLIDLATELRFPGLRTMLQRGLANVKRGAGGTTLCFTAAALTQADVQQAECDDEPTFDVRSLTFNADDSSCRYSRPLLPSEREALAQMGKNPAPTLRTPWDGKGTPVGTATLHVLTVGIDKYVPKEEGGPGRLALSVAGARAVRSFFAAQQGGGVFGKVRLWDALFDSAATGAAIRNRIREMSSEVRAGDVVFIFMSGHGVVPSGQEMFYFAPVDMRNLCGLEARERGIDSAGLANLIRDLPARRIVLVIDACQSGGVLESLSKVGEAKIRQELRRGPPAGAGRATTAPLLESPSVGMYIIVAATPLQSGWQQVGAAQEAGHVGNGPVVQSLLEALAAPASAESGVITMRRMVSVFEGRMKENTAAIGANQTPLVVQLGADFPIAAVRQ